MTLTQCLTLMASIIFLFIVIGVIRRNHLREGYALLWLMMTAVIMIVAIVPGLMKYLAYMMGIKTHAFAVILVLIGGMFLILFQQSIVLSRHQEKIKRLTEELTLLCSKNRDDRNDE